jgi:hypothetical protein
MTIKNKYHINNANTPIQDTYPIQVLYRFNFTNTCFKSYNKTFKRLDLVEGDER